MSETKAEETVINETTLGYAQNLIDSLESGDIDSVRQIMDEIASLRESDLFCEMGKLTRELHDSLNTFKLDSKLEGLTESELPDAKERLNHVITMTEEAADKTLTAVEEAIPLSDEIKSNALELKSQWDKFKDRKLSVEEFRELSKDLDKFFPQITEGSVILNDKLNEILMAQGFQDLTGQIIRRVITLVQDVEQGLVDLIKMSGVPDANKKAAKAKEGLDTTAEGPVVPGVNHASETVDGQDDVDDLLSSLGF